MANPTYPGVHVREEASGARAVAGVPTSIAAFVGMTQRGQLLVPTRILSPRDYERAFGPGDNAGQMTEQVRLFFDNGGGDAWVTRIARNSHAASIMLNEEDGNNTLQLTALEDGVDGNNLRAEVDYNTGSPEATFNLTLYRRVLQDDGSAEEANSETYSNISMDPARNNYVERVINGVSSLAEVQVAGAPQAPGHSESILYSGLILPTDAGGAADTVRERLGGAGDYSLRVSYNGGPATTATVTIGAAATITSIVSDIAAAIQQALQNEGILQVVTGAQINTGSLRQISIEMPGASFEISTGPGSDLAGPLMLTVASGAVYVDHFAMNRPAPTGYGARLHGSPPNNNLAKLTSYAALDKTAIVDWQIADASATGSPGAAPVLYPTGGTMIEGTRFAPSSVADLSQGALVNVQENLLALADAIGADPENRWSAEVHGYRLVLTSNFGTSDADLTAVIATTDGVQIF